MLKNLVKISPATTPPDKFAWLAVALAAGLSMSVGYGQTLIPGLGSRGSMRLRQTDLAVLEQQEPRFDLPCNVSRMKPELDWDFTFHTGYQVRVPVTELVGNGNELTVLFRVVPQDHPDYPAYLMQKTRIPTLEAGSKGQQGGFEGVFTLGEGKYHVDWMMRDQREHICATSWDLETRLNSKDSQLRQWIPKARIQPVEPVFAEAPAVMRAPEAGLPRVSIIVNFDPPDPSAIRLNERDIESLVTILRRIGGDPRIEMNSIIACSLETQQAFYRQEDPSRIFLPALGEALKSLKLGMVDAKRLTSTHGPAEFATDLIREHLTKEKPDALILLGHKTGWQAAVSSEALKSFENPGTLAFYLSYNSEQQAGLSRDPISSIVKRLRGVEYGINRPKDLFNAWSEVVSRIARSKQAAQASTAPKADIQ